MNEAFDAAQYAMSTLVNAKLTNNFDSLDKIAVSLMTSISSGEYAKLPRWIRYFIKPAAVTQLLQSCNYVFSFWRADTSQFETVNRIAGATNTPYYWTHVFRTTTTIATYSTSHPYRTHPHISPSCRMFTSKNVLGVTFLYGNM